MVCYEKQSIMINFVLLSDLETGGSKKGGGEGETGGGEGGGGK